MKKQIPSNNENHLVIAGRDRWDPEHMTIKDRKGVDIVGVQQEYGTVNAVYTFLQDHLGVRWLWPGELGEDIVKQPTIGFNPFTERYHPQIRNRRAILADYYQRAFGPATKTMIGYWEAIGSAATQIGYEGKSEREVWSQAFFDDAYARLDQATAEATKDGRLYGKRVAFVRAGLDYLRLIREMEPFIDRMAETKGKEPEAKAAAQAKWEEIFKEIERIKKEHPFAISSSYVSPRNRYLKNYSPDQFEGKK